MRGTPTGEMREKFLLGLALSRTVSLRARGEFVPEVWEGFKTLEFESFAHSRLKHRVQAAKARGYTDTGIFNDVVSVCSQVWFQNARAKWRRMVLKQEGKSDKCDSSVDGGSLGDLELYGNSTGSGGPPMSPSFMLGGPHSPASLASLDCA
ncbi:hypothetical protein K0M31_016633 [Melipona bicolor]|uniref:Uncharacterized protein n=1 Tax=Melipona bicolor TaxID=60889 RepID=A0AA40KES2_9HYME|nr:hypothetical protein K0M31_016633 [Melipona bicolor]